MNARTHLSAPRMTVYRPYWQMSREGVSIAVRTAGDARALGASMAAAVHAIDSLLPVPTPKTMEDIVAQSAAQPRFQMTLVLFFAAVAALLASLGICGVVAYAVAQRTAELGIRTALGASPQAILAMVVGQGLRPVAIGLAVGLGLSLVVGRAVSSLLYDVSTYDPLTLLGVVVAIGFVSLVAALVPARRAILLNPVAALRQE